MVVGFLASFNEWYPLVEKQWFYMLSCAGMDTLQPRIFFDKNRFVWQYQFNQNFYKMGDYCNTEDLMRKLDPRALFKEKNP